jgi:hypothetical protein
MYHSHARRPQTWDSGAECCARRYLQNQARGGEGSFTSECAFDRERCDAHQLVACSMPKAYTFFELHVPFLACENGPVMYH